MVAPGLIRRAFAVSAVTAASTSRVVRDTSPWTTGHFPARRVEWPGSADWVT